MPTNDPITTDRLIASIREGIATQPALTAQARPVADRFTTLIHYRLPKITAADGDLMIHIAAFLADVMTALTAAGDAPVDAITTATSAIAIAGLKLHDSGETHVAADDAEAATAQAGNEFQLGHGGAWCATCRLPMREGTKVAKVPAVVCKPCAADLAETEGRLDPSRLAARREQETRDRAEGGQ